jgi:hypothetical protein
MHLLQKIDMGVIYLVNCRLLTYGAAKKLSYCVTQWDGLLVYMHDQLVMV